MKTLLHHAAGLLVLLALPATAAAGDTPAQTPGCPPLPATCHMSDTRPYCDSLGVGADFDSWGNVNTGRPFMWSIKVPDGNYRVTVTLGHKRKPSHTIVRAEGRRMMAPPVATRKGQLVEQTFIVNKRDATLPGSKGTVKLNKREKGITRWDDRITLEFNGQAPMCTSVKVEPIDTVATVYLFGNSTVVDQDKEPYASWGQIIPALFDQGIAVANHAESGQAASTFIASHRADKALGAVCPGDWVFIEFGHNDQKQKGPGKGAYFDFMTQMKQLVDMVRSRGASPILVTPTARRAFGPDGKITNTHGEYIDAVRFLASHEGVPLVDLNPLTMQLYEAMGPEGSKRAFVHYPAGTFPGQETALEDNTHFNPYGAFQVARCIASLLPAAAPELAAHLVPGAAGLFLTAAPGDTPCGEAFDPACPDSPDSFYWPLSPMVDIEKPLGN